MQENTDVEVWFQYSRKTRFVHHFREVKFIELNFFNVEQIRRAKINLDADLAVYLVGQCRNGYF